MGVTLITPSLPERAGALAELQASVNRQTVPPDVHLVAVDHAHAGPAAIRNQLLDAVRSDWVAFVDDDDLLDPHHLETLLAHTDTADVVYPNLRCDGPPLPAKHWPGPFDRARLRRTGCFPITVLARTSTLRGAGGFPDARYEDWALWNRIADQGGRFSYVDEITWTYRTAHPERRTNQ